MGNVMINDKTKVTMTAATVNRIIHEIVFMIHKLKTIKCRFQCTEKIKNELRMLEKELMHIRKELIEAVMVVCMCMLIGCATYGSITEYEYEKNEAGEYTKVPVASVGVRMLSTKGVEFSTKRAGNQIDYEQKDIMDNVENLATVGVAAGTKYLNRTNVGIPQ